MSTLRFVAKPFQDLSPRELHDAYRLRCQVFVVEQRITAEPEVDDDDPKAIFFLIYQSDRCVATARVLAADEGHPAKVCRVCVTADQRRQGLGGRLMQQIDQELEGEAAILHAQSHRQGWYARLGWRRVGPPFIEAGIEHVLMRKP